MSPWIIGITGASGAIYAIRLLQLIPTDVPIELVISNSGARVLKEELDLKFATNSGKIEQLGISRQNITVHNYQDIGASIASGSYKTSGMVVVPCSMKSVAEIATGLSSNLIGRATDVILKERRKLILVPRETPFSTIHLRNLLSLSEMGVSIIAACPSYYSNPKSIEDLVDTVVLRIIDQMGLDVEKNELRWKGSK